MGVQDLHLFKVTWQDDVAILTLVQDENAPVGYYPADFAREVFNFLELNKPRCVIIDQAHLMRYGLGEPVCSSAMNSVFVSILRRAKQLGIELRLCRVATPIREVYRVSRIDTLIPIYESLPDAISALPAPGSETRQSPQSSAQ